MSNEVNTVSPLERYLSLRTVRDNVYYDKPVTYNSLDFVDDLPGNAKSLSSMYSDVLPSLGVFSKNKDKRKEQIAKAIDKAKKTKASSKHTVNQALRNAAILGVTGLPTSAALATLFSFLGPRMPFAKGKLRNPFTLSKNLTKFKTDSLHRKHMIKDILDESIKGSLLSAGTGAITPIISGVAKPSDKALEEAGKIIADAPNITALPPVDIVSALNGTNSSRTKNSLTGAGIGALLGTAGAFIPASLNIPKHVLKGILAKKLPFGDIAKDLAAGAKNNLPLSSAVLGTTGAIGGALLPTSQK